MRGSQRFMGVLCLGLVILCSVVPGRAATDRLFELVPADSLFCVRVNNLDAGVRQLEAFLSGLVPEGELPLGVARIQLGSLVGDPELKHVRTDGSIGVFGMASEDGQMLVGLLVPVRSFDQLVKDNAALGQPDAGGVYKLRGGPDGGMVMSTVVRADDGYALATHGDRGDLPSKVAGQMRSGQGRLAGYLDATVAAQAAKAPLWVYGNVQRAAGFVRPFVEMAFAGIEAELQKANEQQQGPGFAPAKIIGMYRQIINAMLSQVEYVTVGIEPSAEAMRFSPTLVAVPGTDLAVMMTASRPGRSIGLLDYLPNGAAINFACRIDSKEGWKKNYDAMLDLFGEMMGETMSEADWAKVRDLTNESIDAMGDNVAFSMSARRGTPPFAITEVIDLADAKAYQRVLDKSIELMKQGVYDDLYGWMGLDTNFEYTPGVAEFRGVRIDAMKISFDTSQKDDPASQAIRAMYGDGLEGYGAIVGDKYVMAMGGRGQRGLERLIGRVQGGRSRGMGSEMEQALALVGGPEKNEFVMTLNIVRLMQMGMAFAQRVAPEDAEIPRIDAESRSNVVVAGRSSKAGRVELDIIVPKAHVMEVKAAAESMEGAKPAGEASDQTKPI